MEVDLPFPPSKLSRNGSQGDYRGKASAAAIYRHQCLILAQAALRGAHISHSGAIMLDITFHMPDRRRRDLDNLLAMAKQAVDAVAQVLGVDDHRFEYTIRRGSVVKHGKVTIRLA